MTDTNHSGAVRGQQVDSRRCPACGRLLNDQPVEKCPLCAYPIDEPRATDADVTPFALSFEEDRGGLIRMCKWVWLAGPQRLKHLAMMRASSASRRFAGIQVVVFGAALGLLRAAWLGWREVSHLQVITGQVTKPAGGGWFRVVTPTPVPGDEQASAIAGLWWNPAQALLGGAIALVAAFVLIALIRLVLRVGLEVAHTRRYRGEQRMTAAQCYATAWLVPLIVATVFLWMHPLTLLAGRTSAFGGDLILMLPAGIIAGIGIVFGWFWFVRLAATAPIEIRTRVTMVLALAVPAIILVSAWGWWFGLEKLYKALFDALQMSY